MKIITQRQRDQGCGDTFEVLKRKDKNRIEIYIKTYKILRSSFRTVFGYEMKRHVITKTFT